MAGSQLGLKTLKTKKTDEVKKAHKKMMEKTIAKFCFVVFEKIKCYFIDCLLNNDEAVKWRDWQDLRNYRQLVN